MQVLTIETIPGKKVTKVHGLVRGNTIRARHVERDILAIIKMLFGGEVTDYTKMLAESREQAIDRMCQEAKSLGANAVICARITTSSMAQGASELLAYGTGVTLEDE